MLRDFPDLTREEVIYEPVSHLPPIASGGSVQ